MGIEIRFHRLHFTILYKTPPYTTAYQCYARFKTINRADNFIYGMYGDMVMFVHALAIDIE